MRITLMRNIKYKSIYRRVKNIVLHLDNDETGRKATEGFINQLGSLFSISDDPAKCGKDFNDYLMMEFVNDRER